MPETKVDLKNLGHVSLMNLDTSSYFQPFGPPLSDLLHRAAWQDESLREYIRLTALDFAIEPVWSGLLAASLQVSAINGTPSPDAVASPLAVATLQDGRTEASPAAPATADPEGSPAQSQEATPRLELASASLLALEIALKAVPPKVVEPSQPFTPALPESGGLALPRLEVLPLRPRITLAPPPEKSASHDSSVTSNKPIEVKIDSKSAAAASPKRIPAVAPAAKAQPAAVKSAPVAKTVPTVQAKAEPPGKPITPVEPGKSAVSPEVRTGNQLDLKLAKQEAKPQPTAEAVVDLKKGTPLETKAEPIAVPSFGQRPSASPSSDAGLPSEGGFFSSLPVAVKIGVPVLALIGALGFFLMGDGSRTPPATKTTNGAESVSVGGQGWVSEWASDAGGSRRGRQLTMYRPSAGLTDYDFEFSGQIESNAMGWVFRAQDTKNYYGMKLASTRPGAAGLTLERFAVVDGRESSVSSKRLGMPVKPGAVYQVRLEARGPRFSVNVDGQPVEDWMDNRLKSGSVGFMNERDERAQQLSVKFRFPSVK